MLYGMYVSAAGALANQYRQEVVANNLANAETVAFKRDLALFQGRQTRSARTGRTHDTAALLEGIGGGVFALPTHTDFSPGPLEVTGGVYDLALNGPGFFQVQGPQDTLYTRDGRFKLDPQHRLVTVQNDYPVLDAAGGAIELNAEGGPVTINERGIVTQDGQEVARLGVVDFADSKALRKAGGNHYRTDGVVLAQPVDTAVKQGCLEGSTVSPVNELVGMINTQRLFEANMTMLQLQDQALGQAVTRLGRIS